MELERVVPQIFASPPSDEAERKVVSADQVPPEPLSTPNERRQFLLAWADENPRATVQMAREVLYARFGQAIGSADIGPILEDSRARHGIESHRKLPKSVQLQVPIQKVMASLEPQAELPSVPLMAKAIQTMGVYGVAIDRDGKVVVLTEPYDPKK